MRVTLAAGNFIAETIPTIHQVPPDCKTFGLQIPPKRPSHTAHTARAGTHNRPDPRHIPTPHPAAHSPPPRNHHSARALGTSPSPPLVSSMGGRLCSARTACGVRVRGVCDRIIAVWVWGKWCSNANPCFIARAPPYEPIESLPDLSKYVTSKIH